MNYANAGHSKHALEERKATVEESLVCIRKARFCCVDRLRCILFLPYIRWHIRLLLCKQRCSIVVAECHKQSQMAEL